MDKESREIVTSVLKDVLDVYAPYPREVFSKFASAVSAGDSHVPTEPGERAYTGIVSIPVEKGEITPVDARALAYTNRKSIVDALDMLFPQDKVKSYLNHALGRLSLVDDGVREYDSTALMPEVLPSSYGNKSHEKGRSGSPMHINRTFGVAANGNFNNAELVRGYIFLKEQPEFGLAVKWLTGAMTDFAIEMEDQISTRPEFSKLKGSGLTQTLNMFTHKSALALMDGRFPVSVGVMLSKSANHHDAPEVVRSLSGLSEYNVFKRPRNAPDGKEYTGMCPATRFNIGLLRFDLGDVGNPEDSALMRFSGRIKDTLSGSDPAVTSAQEQKIAESCAQYSAAIDSILTTPEAFEAMKEWGCPYHG